MGYERLAEDLLIIGDDPCLGLDGGVDHAAVQRARLMCDNRKWLLSKMLPKQFGDKVTQEITGEDGGAVISRIELVAVDPRPRQGELPADGDEAGEVRRFPPRLTDSRSG